MISPDRQMNPTKNIFEIKSTPDPSRVSGAVGLSPGYDLGAQKKEVVLHYQGKGDRGEFFLTADVFDLPGQPLHLLVYCPLCKNNLRISQEQKAIDFDPRGMPKFSGYRTEEVIAGLGVPSLGGLLSVEPFGCTWEAEPELRRKYGFSICPWRVAIDNNIVRDT